MMELEEIVDKLLVSYDLEFLMEENDVTEHCVLSLLIEEKLIDISEYLEELEGYGSELD